MFDSYFKKPLEQIMLDEAWVTPIGDGRYFVIRREGFEIKILGTVNEYERSILEKIWGIIFSSELELQYHKEAQ